jgi:hypothetical protein
MTEDCGTCKFYRDRDIRGGVMSGHGSCKRYPEAIKTNDGKWCGEHVAVSAPDEAVPPPADERTPEATHRTLLRVFVQSPVASQEQRVQTGVDMMDQFSDVLACTNSMGQRPTRWVVGSHVIDAVRLATGHPPVEEGSTDINELFGIPMEQSVDLPRGRVTLRCSAGMDGSFTIDTRHVVRTSNEA